MAFAHCWQNTHVWANPVLCSWFESNLLTMFEAYCWQWPNLQTPLVQWFLLIVIECINWSFRACHTYTFVMSAIVKVGTHHIQPTSYASLAHSSDFNCVYKASVAACIHVCAHDYLSCCWRCFTCKPATTCALRANHWWLCVGVNGPFHVCTVNVCVEGGWALHVLGSRRTTNSYVL